MMKYKSVFAAALASALLAGCATPIDPMVTSYQLTTPFAISDPQLEGEIQTANPEDIVYSGEIRVALAATLDGAYSASFDF